MGDSNSFRRLGRNLSSDARGNVAILFGLSLTFLVGFSGFAIDFAKAFRAETQAQSAADAATLAAVSTAKNYISSQASQSDAVLDAAAELADQTANSYFSQGVASNLNAAVTSTTKVTLVYGVITANVQFTMRVPTNFGSLFGVTTFDVAGASTAATKLSPYVEVHLLIDTSGSMALGATPAGQAALVAFTGCAFACHDNQPVGGYADAFAYARANNIMLRHDAVDQGIRALMSTIDTVDTGHHFISTKVYSFDNLLTQNTGLTTDTSVVRSNLPSSPAISGMTAGATKFNEIVPLVVSAIGSGGDGSTPSRPLKLVIIATDGVNDPGRYWTTDVAARTQVAPFDTSFCSTLQSNNVRVGIIHTPYLAMTYDWGYMATLGQPSQIGGPASRADDIATVLQACAGSLYVQASDPAAIAGAFVTIFQSVAAVRIVN